MVRKNIRFYVRNKWYFIVDQYQKDTCFYNEGAYFYYDIDVGKIWLSKQGKNKYFIRCEDSDKMDIVPLQLKIKNFYWETDDDDGRNERIYIENSYKEFFGKIRKIWNKIIELLSNNNRPDFIKTNVIDDEEYMRVNILRNTNFVKSICYKDEIIIVLHSVVNNNVKASFVELINHSE